MSLHAFITLAILLATLLLMGTQRLRGDVTALLATLALILSGVLTVEEALSAFGQPVIIIIAALYVIGAALYDTGVATLIAGQLVRFARRGPTVLLLVIMFTAALLSAFVSGLLVVAVMLPAVTRIARKAEMAPAQLLLPLGNAAVMGNMLTLIGSVSNVAINDVLVSQGFEPLNIFSVTPFGLVSLLIAMAWFALLGRRLLPREANPEPEPPTLQEVAQTYELQEQLYRVRLRTGSDLIGVRLMATDLAPTYNLHVMAVQPDGKALQPPYPDRVLEQDDVLVVKGARGDVHQATALHHLEPLGPIPLELFEQLEQHTLSLAEVIVPFRSGLVDKSITESHFRERYGLSILAVHRGGHVVRKVLPEIKLEPGDTLLVQGSWERLDQINDGTSLVLSTHLGPQLGDVVSHKVGATLLILALMLAAVVSGMLPLATAGLAAVVAFILTGAISAERAYKSIDPTLLVLVGGMLPLATALQKTGLAAKMADLLFSFGRGANPFITLLVLYLLAALLTQIISNSVTGVLLLPIATNLALAQHVSPHAYAIALMVAVGASFVTSVTHAGGLMLREPGGYTVRDFVMNNGPIFLLQTAALIILLQLLFF